MTEPPRVTLGIATYNRDTYLAEAIRSGLEQDYESLEVLVVVDGSTNPRIDNVLAGFADDGRLRVVRHDSNRGIAAAYNTFISEGRGELIAMLGDDDIALPGRITREVEIFDRFPDTGVVHGDGTIIDELGHQIGQWPSVESSPEQMVRWFFFSHNHIADPTRMVHRRVYDAVGGYDDRYPVANDFDFWLRAARSFRFRYCTGAPLTAIRRHGKNTSDESSGQTAEVADVEAILDAALERYGLRELIPSIGWDTLGREEAERRALLRVADGLDKRLLPLPALAQKLRHRAAALPAPARAATGSKPRKLMMTAFGWNDSGGGTTVPRLAAKELARRGWDVTVFHAAVPATASGKPYELTAWEEDGVRLIGVHNRPHGLFDIGNPLRELDDPLITAAFAASLDSIKPDVVHFHNLHNLGAALIDHAAVRALPSFFTTHNYWLICPRAYLLTGHGSICDGPGDGSRCASCTGSTDLRSYQRRLTEIRARAESGLTRILAVSDSVRRTLLAVGYDPMLVDVVRQAMPHESEIWEAVGRERQPGRLREQLTLAFVGSAYPHKGPQLLVEAAQRTSAELEVRILGEISPAFAEQLRAIDRRGTVKIHGGFTPAELGALLREVDAAVLPSMWWDCAPLAAAECLAARIPLVVPRLGGLPESIRDGFDGLTFNGLDAGDLARQLDRLALEPDLLPRLQRNIAEPHAFSEYIDTLEAYYDGDIGSGEPVVSPSDVGSLAVRWKGDHGLQTSLSIINDQITERLTGPVQKVAANGTPVDPPLPRLADVEVRQQWPPDLSVPSAGALAVIAPWEFGSIPSDWVNRITENVDELWVPSEYVRSMYLNGGIDPARVVVVQNGVDLELFRPAEPRGPESSEGPTRFLYVGGITQRKGYDVLLEAWDAAFPDNENVVLVFKAAAAGGAYGALDSALLERAASPRLPRVELIADDLDTAALADLYRSCDVFVLPYRGEGFAMPVLEAMACGLPVIVTANGPTDEFCPPDAGWRIRSTRKAMSAELLGPFSPVSEPWMLEPDLDHLVQLLREAAESPSRRQARGVAGRVAAEAMSWDAIAARYSDRLAAIAHARSQRMQNAVEPFPLHEPVATRVLATPAWRGPDRLHELLDEWSRSTTRETSACLYLLADPNVAGSPEEIEASVVRAAERAQVDLDTCADINILLEPFQASRDVRLHRAVDLYVSLHPACEGHARLARSAGSITGTPRDGTLATCLRSDNEPSRQ